MYDSGRSAAGDRRAPTGSRRSATKARCSPSSRDVLAQNADAVAQYRGGKTATFGFLVGQAMKASKGKGNPKS